MNTENVSSSNQEVEQENIPRSSSAEQTKLT